MYLVYMVVGKLQEWLLWGDTRRCLCQAEPVSAGSKTDLLFSKSEPLSDIGSASVITYLRNMLTKAAGRAKWNDVGETALKTPRSVRKEGEKVLQALEVRFPCSLWWRQWWCKYPPYNPWRAYPGAGSWQELWCCGEQPSQKQVFWHHLWPHSGLTLEQSLKNCRP